MGREIAAEAIGVPGGTPLKLEHPDRCIEPSTFVGLIVEDLFRHDQVALDVASAPAPLAMSAVAVSADQRLSAIFLERRRFPAPPEPFEHVQPLPPYLHRP